MDLATIKQRVNEYVQKQIDADIFRRAFLVKTLIKDAINEAIGTDTEFALSRAQKITILLQLPNIEDIKLDFQPGDSVGEAIDKIFLNEISNHFQEIRVDLAATTIERHLLKNVERVLKIAKHKAENSVIDRNSNIYTRFHDAYETIINGTVTASDVIVALEGPLVLSDLILRAENILSDAEKNALLNEYGTSFDELCLLRQNIGYLSSFATAHEVYRAVANKINAKVASELAVAMKI